MDPQQKALILLEKQGKFEVGSRSIPSPGTGQLLVKVQSVALNPVDYKIQEYGFFVDNYPAVLGVDIAGIVEEVGEGVENFSKGDNVLDNISFSEYRPVSILVYRVAHGAFSNDMAAFQQYTLTVASFTAQIPSNQSFDGAATLPLGLDTAVTGMYGKDFGAGITPPWAKSGVDNKSKGPIVIIGGASSVGSYVIQLARLSGFYPIIATASPSNEHLLKEAISQVTDSPIKIVYDAIALPDTQQIGWGLLAENGTLVLTLPASVKENEGKERKAIATFGTPHMPQNQELGRNSWAMVEKWLSEGAVQPNKYEVLPSGLEGIIGGLERLKNGQVSGTKLVAHPQETQ
ncbi:hypothetical protein AZE42_12053 [Rhizopogon vesiculosus]|uniref:Enoyl reductase (ER) domain-containing protein n=1 Tax=Rhizopogon vesiculosus TaxID=180088 RepID=A0A1J8QGB3_9AGAM|nr:hypothetical protein AZE42_12053 [Rhizopogon vesiculosus]